MKSCNRRLASALITVLLYSIASAQTTREKVYLQFDKPYYLTGENCWFKAYVVDENLAPTSTSGILYVDFIDPSGIIAHQQLKLYSGETSGDFSFNQVPGSYTVRAYTNYMRNDEPDFFYYRSLMVYGDSISVRTDSTRKIDLQFFPEGGEAVDHLLTQVAFKAIDQSGKGANVSGQIVDEKNNIAGSLRSLHQGMGIFPYMPEQGKKYKVVLTTGEEFPLPEAAASGVVMSVNNMHPDKILLRLQNSENTPLMLTGASRGKTVFHRTFRTTKQQSNIEILKKDLPFGILQLTASSESGTPLAERILFVKQKEKVNIQVTPASNQVHARDSISIKIKTTNGNGLPLAASLSLSVIDADLISSDSTEANMFTHLLMQSDLKGNILHPAWYLQPGNEYALDLVMLTNGWRKYEQLKTILYKPEQSLALSGTVVSATKNELLHNADISLMIADIEYVGVYTTTADASGHFRIDSVDYGDSTNLVWQVKNEKGKLTDAKIKLDPGSNMPEFDKKFVSEPIASAQPLLSHRLYTDTSKVGLLDTVEVIRRKKSYRTVGGGAMLLVPGKGDMKSMTTTFLSKYALALPHLKPVENNQGETFWVTPGGGSVSIVINGYQVHDRTAAGNPYLVLNTYRPDELEYAIVGGNNHDGYMIALQTK